ncbi:MAG TPA: hypothetical protein VJR89_41955, partial [Polyangiales bacterium]|nr:hypothetical protein [Polyangiales bacterium]
DGTANCHDGCADDAAKIAAGTCGCGVADTDSDGDGTANCHDGCADDAAKIAAGVCGCGVADTDSDGDGTANCNDGCPDEAAKTTAGTCGCGIADTDSDGDNRADCVDVCPGYDDSQDSDDDGTPDGCDEPTDCTEFTVGTHTHYGDAFVHSVEDLAALDGVVCITGSLYIGGSESELTNLVGLDSLIGVAGSVSIAYNENLTSLDGLDALRTVGNLGIFDNDVLEDLLGLSSLTTVRGNVDIEGNALLGSVDGLEQLTSIAFKLRIANNASLLNLNGLSNLEELGTLQLGTSLYIRGNAQLPQCWVWMLQQRFGASCGDGYEQCDGNSGVGSCGTLPPDFACVPGATGPGVYDGYLYVYTSEQLASLSGLSCVTGGLSLNYLQSTDLGVLSNLQSIGGYLSVYGSSTLTSLHGLENLRSIGYGVMITGNSSLTSLSALSGVTSVGSRLFEVGGSNTLSIQSNLSLPSCQAWQLAQQFGLSCGTDQAQCTGNTGTGSCGSLPPGFACVPGAVGPGVYDGWINISPWGGMQLNELGGLTCVTQDLRIYGSSATDLGILSSLEQVAGSLSLFDNQALTSLAGLENLKTVGRSLDVSDHGALTSLAGLSSLTSVAGSDPYGSLNITNNTNLPQCWVWALEEQVGKDCGWGNPETGYYQCRGNRGQGSCGELPSNFACVPGATGPGVYDGWLHFSPWDTNSLQLDELGGLTCVTEGMMITDTNATDFSSLSSLQKVGGSLSISSNQSLVSLTGLEQLSAVGWHLSVWGNDALTSLAALSSLTSIGDQPNNPTGGSVQIENNASLPACWAWSVAAQAEEQCGTTDWYGNWRECRGNRGQGSCGELPADFACVPGATGPGVYDGWLYFSPWDTTRPQLDELGGLTCVTQSVMITSTNATDLSGLSSLQKIGGSLSLSSNQSLVSLAGLERLTSVGGQLGIDGNEALTSLAALSSLTSIGGEPTTPPGGNVTISNNASLPACWAWGVAANAGQRCGRLDWNGTWLECRGNTGQGSCGALPADFACVPGATGPGVYDGSIYSWGPNPIQLNELGGLTCVTGDLYVTGSTLTDLSALYGLQKVGGSFQIFNNQSLSSLTGLEQLSSVGHHLDISYNNVLSDLGALGSLTSIGDNPGNPYPGTLSIGNNASLSACEPAAVATRTGEACGQPDWNTGNWIACGGNLGAGDCIESLPPYFMCTPGATGPGVYDGTLDFSAMFPNGVPAGAFGGVQCVTGDLVVSQTALSDLTLLSHLQMVGGRVAITDNSSLGSIAGLEQLTQIRGALDIMNNPALVDLAPLSQLTSLGQAPATPPDYGVLNVTSNAVLPGCWAWMLADRTGQRCGHPVGFGDSQWTECRGNTGAGSCGEPPEGFVCESGAVGPGIYRGMLMVGSTFNGGWTLAELGGVTCVLGSVLIGDVDLQDLMGPWDLRSIDGALYINENPNLVSLAGLENLEYVGQSLEIRANAVLSDLSGLANLVSLAENADEIHSNAKLSIQDNPSLPACWETVLEDQTGLQCGTNWNEVWTDCSGNTGAGTCD